MAAFINNDITTAGLIVLAKGVAGQKINYTKIVLGDGYLEEGQTPRTLTGVVSPKATVDITKLKINGDGTVAVGGIFTNGDETDGFYYRELGLYAEDPDPEVGEVLYCYGNCGDLAEWIPPSGGATIVEKTIDIVTAIGTATNVTAYHAKDPKPGDQIFFSTAHSKSNVSHTGLVEKVDGSKVYTIEGNTSDRVARRSYYLSDSYIVGYGRPAYDAEPGNTNTGSQTPSSGTTSEVTYTVVAGDTLSKIAAKYGTTYQKLAAYNGITNPNIIRVGQKIKIPGTPAPKKTNAEIAKEVIAGKWGNGADRKKRLEAAGYDYNAIQQAVNAALAR